MNELNRLSPRPGAQKTRLRVGRGPGSGAGKTANRGQKGQKARGGRTTPGFEGGQSPMIKRIPIRGFSNARFATHYQLVNVASLDRFEEGTEVTPQLLADVGLIRKADGLVKILGDGDLSVKLTIQAHHVSKGAQAKIEAKGGQVELIGNTSAG